MIRTDQLRIGNRGRRHRPCETFYTPDTNEIHNLQVHICEMGAVRADAKDVEGLTDDADDGNYYNAEIWYVRSSSYASSTWD